MYQKFINHYVRVTRIPLLYNPMAHDSDCYLFLKQFSEDDLTRVCKHIRTRYEKDERIMMSMLRFSYLVRQLDTFAELLGEAKAMGQKRVTERDSVLNSTGRAGDVDVSKEKPAKQAGQVMREYSKRLSKEELQSKFAAMRAVLDTPPEEPPQEDVDLMPYQPILMPTNTEQELNEANNFGVEIVEEPNHQGTPMVEEQPPEQP